MKMPKSSAKRVPLRPEKNPARPQSPLVSSPAQAKRESAGLRRGRERLESSPTAGETDIRTSLI